MSDVAEPAPADVGLPVDEPIRVLLADDHPMFREGLAVALGALPGVEVVAEASSGEEAIGEAARLQPDVVVMDVNMPGVNGIEATRRIVAESPHIGVLILTMFDEDESVFQAMRAGARGYLLKGADRDAILRAVAAVGRGDAIFGPALARRLIGYFTSSRAGAAPFADLTDREREVLELGGARPQQRRDRPSADASARRRSATTCPTSSPSCRSATAPRRSSVRARPGSAPDQAGTGGSDPSAASIAASSMCLSCMTPDR